MRNDFLQLVYLFLVLVIGASCEELLPKPLGVGFPVLLAAVVLLAPRVRLPLAVLFAVAAGATEDALSALTPMTSVAAFLLAAVVARRVDLPAVALTLATYPVYELWVGVWTGGLNVFTRILLAVPVGLLTAAVATGVLTWTMRKAAIDERG